MESAALTLLAASMGVLFGWQPMPDGSDRYEYVVQIEPAMLDTLRAGESIPITSDIPEEIGPIGRIRIVVGNDPLPRQKLVTNLKPWPKQESREGLVEAQYTVPPVENTLGSRYGAQQAANNQILPSQGNAATSNPFGQALQRGAEQAREAMGNAADQILPPNSNELFGNAGDSVRQAVDNTADRLAQGLNRGAEQAANEFGNRAANAIDQFGRSSVPQGQERSLLSQNSPQAGGSILPRDSQTTPQQSPKGQRIDEPIQPQQPGNDWQRGSSAPPASFADQSGGGTNPTSQYGEFNAPWPQTSNPVTQTNNPNSQTAGGGRYPSQQSQPSGQSSWSNQQPQRDSFDLANLPNQNSSQSSFPQNNAASNNNQADGPSFPNLNNQPQQSPSDSWSGNSPTPTIRKDMLDEPVGNDSNFAGNNPGNFNSQGFSTQQVNRPTTDSPTGGNFNNWPQGNNASLQNSASDGRSNNNNVMLIAVLSVLATGFGAGNLFQWWSYFNLRSKYHGLVHGGRHSRFDD